MIPLHLSTFDTSGGAARAAFRLHQAMLRSGMPSQMQVAIKASDVHTVRGPANGLRKWLDAARIRVSLALMHRQQTPNTELHSLALLPSGLVTTLNQSNADVLHLHWICNEFLSIEDIGRLRKPLVWTIHDMWPFCGAEHYTEDTATARWRQGYSRKNRPAEQCGIDLDRWVWQRKRRAWQHPMHIVAPSQWLADCTRSSALMNNWPIYVIPYALDMQCFQPCSKAFARQILNLPQYAQLVLFGDFGGGHDPRKGWDLLQPALSQIANGRPDIAGVIFGQSEPAVPPRLGLPLYWMGRVFDDVTLRLLYNACDVMVVPSRQDNLPQTGTEAQACGCPVVAFNVSGLPSVVAHQTTGYLARPFDVEDLAAGIAWVLADRERHQCLSQQARERAVRLWDPEVVVGQYREVYECALELSAIEAS